MPWGLVISSARSWTPPRFLACVSSSAVKSETWNTVSQTANSQLLVRRSVGVLAAMGPIPGSTVPLRLPRSTIWSWSPSSWMTQWNCETYEESSCKSLSALRPMRTGKRSKRRSIVVPVCVSMILTARPNTMSSLSDAFC